MFFIYSLKVGFCLIAFYLFFKLLLSKETFHTFNRMVLLAVMGVSLLIPWLKMTTAEPTTFAQGVASVESMIVSAEAVDVEKSSGLSVLQMMFLVYISGVLLFLIREAVSVVRLWGIMRKGTALTPQHTGGADDGKESVRTIVMKDDVAPFSWFHYIVMSEKDYRENPREILIHELAHIRLGHSWDVALCNLLIIFQWWNPAAWLLKRELQNVHEFEADEAVIQRGVDARQYQMLLIRKSVGERLFSMANNLNHHSLKKRITMMKTKKSSPWQKAKVLIALPMAALAVVAFANPEVEHVAGQVATESEAVVSKALAEVKTQRNAAASRPTELAQAGESPAAAVESGRADTAKVNSLPVFDVVEQMPQFPGGMASLGSWLGDNIKYPKDAHEARQEGRVIARFIVEKDGSISNVEIIRSVFPSLDAEAVRIVQSMPKWNPGMQNGENVRVKYTIPISFKLTGGDDYTVGNDNANADKNENAGALPHSAIIRVAHDHGNKNPLIVVDGKEVGADMLSQIKPDDIESVDVLKDGSATKLYGEKAKDGAILIKMKKK